jgi:uncharacterized protein YbjT (DUF2867 family)
MGRIFVTGATGRVGRQALPPAGLPPRVEVVSASADSVVGMARTLSERAALAAAGFP